MKMMKILTSNRIHVLAADAPAGESGETDHVGDLFHPLVNPVWKMGLFLAKSRNLV